MSWKAQVESFLESRDYADTTRSLYRRIFEEFRLWFEDLDGDEPDAEQLDSGDARLYREHLERRPAKASTVNVHLSALRSLAEHFGRELRVRRMRQERPAIRVLSARQANSLLKAAGRRGGWMGRRNVAALSLMARAGLRLSEVLNLHLDDVVLRERGSYVLVRRGKGRKQRRVPLSVRARRALKGYLAVRPAETENSTDLLLITGRGGRMDRRFVQRLVKQAAMKAGIEDWKDIKPHTLRHSFATNFLEKNPGGLATLGQILGHEHLTTTMRYLHPREEEVQGMVEEM